MKVEIYIPDYETEVIKKVLELKAKRKLSNEVVSLMKGECSLTEEKVIELIRKYAGENKENKVIESLADEDILGSINSVLGNGGDLV